MGTTALSGLRLLFILFTGKRENPFFSSLPGEKDTGQPPAGRKFGQKK